MAQPGQSTLEEDVWQGGDGEGKTDLAAPESKLPEPRLDEGGQGDNNAENTDRNPPPPPQAPQIFTSIGYHLLHTIFSIFVAIFILGLFLYAATLTGIFDPCQHLYVSRISCTDTPHFAGFLHQVSCNEQKHCVLPGFSSETKKMEWRLA